MTGKRDDNEDGTQPQPRVGCFPFGVVEYSAVARFVKENQHVHLHKERRRPRSSFEYDNIDFIYKSI
jgi:hypothetical protein